MKLSTHTHCLRVKSISLVLLIFLCIQSLALIIPSIVEGYYTNMPADLVVGQSDFISSSSATTQSTLANTVNFRDLFVDPRGRLIVADEFNNRVLIWNQVPTTNGKAADLVLGQPDFVSSTTNNGGISGSSFSKPDGIFSDGSRLVVSDRVNLRVLIWNNFPTSNGQSADVVVGAVDLNTIGQNTCSLTRISQPTGVWIYNDKLLIGSRQQGRLLIYNSVPTASNSAADITVGASNCAIASGASDATSSNFNDISDVAVDDQGRLLWQMYFSQE